MRSGCLNSNHDANIMAVRPVARGGKHTDRPRKSSRRGRDDQPTRRVEPLQVVDRDQQWGLLGQPFDDRDKRGANGALVRHRADGALAQQHPIDGELLWRRQFREGGVVQPFHQGGQRAIRQY